MPMTHAKRMTALQRLRKAAQAAIGAPTHETQPSYRRRTFLDGTVDRLEFMGTKKVKSKPYRRLESAWRSFPECERDERVPSPQEVLAICDRMEAEQAADDEFQRKVKA